MKIKPENGSHRLALNSRNFENLGFFGPILIQICWGGSSDELIAVAFQPHRSLKIAGYPANFREPFTKCTDDLHFQPSFSACDPGIILLTAKKKPNPRSCSSSLTIAAICTSSFDSCSDPNWFQSAFSKCSP